MEDQFTITLEGGRPWGFSLQGGVDFRSPLRAGRVSHLRIFEITYHGYSMFNTCTALVVHVLDVYLAYTSIGSYS